MSWSGGTNKSLVRVLKAKFKSTTIPNCDWLWISSDFFVKVNSKILILQPTGSFNFEILDKIPELNSTHLLACHLF